MITGIKKFDSDPWCCNPLIDRPVSGEMNELVIGRRTHGYVALYRYIAVIDTVFVLAIRSQREAGYVRE